MTNPVRDREADRKLSPCVSTDLKFSPGDQEPDFLPDPKLAAEGWQRRFMVDQQRAEEAAELYTSLGYKVHLEPVKPSELHKWCTKCQTLVCRSFVTLYTRK